MKYLQNIRYFLSSMLGLDRLDDRFLRFFKTHICFAIFTNLHGVFVNTLFFRVTGDSGIVMRYNVIAFAASGLFMMLAVLYLKRFSPLKCMRVGIFLYIIMYVVFFATMGVLGASMPVIALLAGAAGGFYWIAYAMGISYYAQEGTRDVALGVIAIGCGFVSLCMPFLSGFIISRFSGVLGYAIMFGTALVMAVVTILLSRKMTPIEMEQKETHYREALRITFRNKMFFNLVMSNLVKGIREGTLSFFLNILLFQIITNEMAVGVNTFLSSVASILAAMLYGRLIRLDNRVKSMLVSTIVLLAAALMLFLNLSPATIMLFSMVNAFFNTYLLNPSFSILFSALQTSPEVNRMQGEIHAIKECFLNVGRILGIGITLLMPQTNFGSVLAVIILTLFQFIMVWQLKVAVKQIDQINGEKESREALQG